MDAAGIIAKLDKALKKFTPIDRTAYLRTITRIGGDDLTGRVGTVTVADTELYPQPFFSRLGRQRVAGDHTKSEMVSDSTGKALLADDWQFIISPTAASITTLSSDNTVMVLVDSAGNEEVLRMLDCDAPSAYGADLAYIAYFRSVKRP